jgi:hypothetical protein
MLPQGLFDELIELNWLFLNLNNLTVIRLYAQLKNLQNLKVLDLADNRLQLTDEVFPPMQNITEM